MDVVFLTDGTTSFEGRTVSAEDLRARLQDALGAAKRKVVSLRADTETRHGDGVRVMDFIRGAGAEELTVAARAPAP